MTESLTRNNYARLFKGIYNDIAVTVPSKQVSAVFDRTYMPALAIEPGKYVYHTLELDQGDSQAIAFPDLYDDANRLYVAVETDAIATVVFVPTVDPLETYKVPLKATNTDAAGEHNSFFSIQMRLDSLTIVIPSTGNGGGPTNVRIFMYEIPDVDFFESYIDQQVGLGISGEVTT